MKYIYIGQPLEWCKLPLKTLENDDVEIAITHCGICATDLHVMNSDWGPTDYPFVGGHEQVYIYIYIISLFYIIPRTPHFFFLSQLTHIALPTYLYYSLFLSIYPRPES